MQTFEDLTDLTKTPRLEFTDDENIYWGVKQEHVPTTWRLWRDSLDRDAVAIA